LLLLLLLPPGDGRDFIKAFGKMAEDLEDAKGKLALVLSKPAGAWRMTCQGKFCCCK
jgi:hypothetical protein